MKASLLDDATRAQLAVRAQQLTAEARPAWGRMGVVAMLNHLNLSFQSASGELRLQRALIGRVFGAVAKRVFVRGDAAFMKNGPTDPQLLQEEGGFEPVLAEFLARLDRFAQPGGIGEHPHAFFGTLTREEWGWLMAKHVDHHLRQFGV